MVPGRDEERKSDEATEGGYLPAPRWGSNKKGDDGGRGPGVAARHAGTLPPATGRRPVGAESRLGARVATGSHPRLLPVAPVGLNPRASRLTESAYQNPARPGAPGAGPPWPATGVAGSVTRSETFGELHRPQSPVTPGGRQFEPGA